MSQRLIVNGDEGIAAQYIRVGEKLVEGLRVRAGEDIKTLSIKKVYGDVTVEASILGLTSEITITVPVSPVGVLEIPVTDEDEEIPDCFLPTVPPGEYLTDLLGLPMEEMIRITPDFGWWRQDAAPSTMRVEDVTGDRTENWYFESQDPLMLYEKSVGYTTPRLWKNGYHLGFNVRIGDALWNCIDSIDTTMRIQLGTITSYDNYFPQEVIDALPPPISGSNYYRVEITPYYYDGTLDGQFYGVWGAHPQIPGITVRYGDWYSEDAYSQVFIWRGSMRRGNNVRKCFVITYHQIGSFWDIGGDAACGDDTDAYTDWRSRYTIGGSNNCSPYGSNTHGPLHTSVQVVIVDDEVLNISSNQTKKCDAAIGIFYKSLGFEYEWDYPDEREDENGHTIYSYIELEASALSGLPVWKINNKYNESAQLRSSLMSEGHWFKFSYIDGSIDQIPDAWAVE